MTSWSGSTAVTPSSGISRTTLRCTRSKCATMVDPSRSTAHTGHRLDLQKAIEANIDRYPRARQKVVAPVVRFHGRPYWVEARDSLDVRRHLDERQAIAPGGRRQLDAVLSDLAERRLPLDQPLWRVTLVHGLEHGRQALVCQIHHAITDGSAAAAAFEGLTTAEPGGEPDMPPIPPLPPTQRSLLSTATRQVPRWWVAGPQVVRAVAESNRRAAAYREVAEHLPPAGLSQSRDTFLVRSSFDDRRVCATATLPLADFQKVSRWAGVTVNGTLHAVLAGALRAERLRRGEDVSEPLVAAFGIALDDPDAPRRRWGLRQSPDSLHVHAAHRRSRPRSSACGSAASAKEGVEDSRRAPRRAPTPCPTSATSTPADAGAFLLRRSRTSSRRSRTSSPPTSAARPRRAGSATARWSTGTPSLLNVPPVWSAACTVYSYAGAMRFGLLYETGDLRRSLSGSSTSRS